jgi:outer membrane protein assembly factor BamB
MPRGKALAAGTQMGVSMTDAESRPGTRRPLRLWPAVALVALQWLGWFVVPRVSPEATLYGLLGGLACGPLLGVWWLFFSRAPWVERLGGAVLVIAAMVATPYLLHESVAQGNLGFQFYLVGIPVVSLAFAIWAVATRRLADVPRRVAMVAAVLIACGAFTLLRSKGVHGDGFPEYTWRWAPTAEERLLARTGSQPLEVQPPPPSAPGPGDTAPSPAVATDETPRAAASPEGDAGPPEEAVPAAPDDTATAPAPVAVPARRPPEWPGFRGPARDGVIPGLRIDTDWSASPPVELWRQAIGPGVSSFAVSEDRVYTQEQRGEYEVVACYDLATGELVWRHADANRFWDSHVGAGPRATPAVAGDRVYTLGAKGVLNAFDAASGRVVWSRNAGADASAETPSPAGGGLPLWGFVSSPLVVGQVVIVHAGALVAYDIETGEPCWSGPKGGSYSSPQLLTIDGVEQVVLMTHAGVTSVAPADGRVLWEHSWPGIGIMQPVLAGEGDLLISTIDGGAAPIGTRRLAVARGPEGWKAEERWTSVALKPSFSPVVAHEGYAYGFDGRFVACIDVAKGERQWKGGRYGSGQLLLLSEQDLLLVVSEEGELALVRAAPDGFAELARVSAIEGRTWNQPALIEDVLLLRNGEEMAAFRLPRVSG